MKYVFKAKQLMSIVAFVLLFVRLIAQNQNDSLQKQQGHLVSHLWRKVVAVTGYHGYPALYYSIRCRHNEARISGSTEISLILSKKTDTLLFDLIHLYHVSSIKVNNKAVTFNQQDDKIFITLFYKF